MIETLTVPPTSATDVPPSSGPPPPSPSSIAERTRISLELTVTSAPDAVGRIVRVASSGSSTLLTLWLGAPVRGRRRMRLSVGGDAAGLETMRKRLDRVVDVIKVKVKVAS